ncbi:MAG: DUF86 domain-containing protein [Clostridiales bacterium]|nr:DUF86 domain-containing protein [Clostridiales bacterium]
MTEKDRLLLSMIMDYCQDIQSTIQRFGGDKDLFDTDKDFRNSLCMSIIQIGEMAKRLSVEYMTITNREIPWHDIIGMRNFITHDYGNIDIDLTWETVSQDIPDLYRFCNKELH